MSEECEYRGYIFVNTALSSIQKGVQGAHAIVELTERYNTSSCGAAKAIWDWRANHKTLIFLEAGFHQGLLDNYLTFASHCENLGLPHALFVEDDETMNSMATAFAGIVPDYIYDIDLKEYDMMRPMITNGLGVTTYPYDDPNDIALCKFLKQFHLAR